MADSDPPRRPTWLVFYVFPILSGLLLGASHVPLPTGFLAYVGLIPLLLSVAVLSGRSAFMAGFIHGIFYYAATIYWIAWITPPGVLAAVFYLSLWRGLTIWAISVITRRSGSSGLLASPFIWVGLEYVSSLGDLGFPWVLLGASQVDYLPLVQHADLFGVFGVSFWLVLVNLALLQIWRKRSAAGIATLVVLFVAPMSYGLFRMDQTHGDRTLNVGVTQPNLEPLAKEFRPFDTHFAVLKGQTIEAHRRGARLVVWPETAVPAYFHLRVNQHYRDLVQSLVDSLGVHLYTGGNHLEIGPPRKTYNASFLFSPGTVKLERYDKMRLVPFGERTPFPDLLPGLRTIRFTGSGFVSGNWDSGEQYTVFKLDGTTFSGMICFDSAFPQQARRFVRDGAEFLAVITNDGWFGRTSGPYQHAKLAVFRAIENRRSVVRCANTGVSALIDPAGRMTETSGIFVEALATGSIQLNSGMTFYAQNGDLFSQVVGIIGLVIILVARFWPRNGDGSVVAEDQPAYREVEDESAGDQTAAMIEVEESEDKEDVLINPEVPDNDQPMPFLDHLEELRWNILRGLAGVVIGAVICGICADTILAALTIPYREMNPNNILVTLKPMGMFMVKLNIALVGGAILALPWVLYQLWEFVAPGLFPTERRYVSFIVVSFTICFVIGGSVAYFGVVPLSLRFLVGLTTDTDVVAQFDVGMYIGFVLRLLVAFGAVFELPVATFFLVKVGVLTAERMRVGRRYAILVGFVLAAFLTPPDPISQMMMALPLILLYEISIWVARVAQPKG
ncbi:apolipoprotein N-acyltransferase [bacterium]|nr:apolipoprotein N-acyltransferase [bacterium]